LVFWGRDPAVALRYTAGYAHHTPCGVKIPIAVAKNIADLSYALQGRYNPARRNAAG
jgi:hypothetical protein